MRYISITMLAALAVCARGQATAQQGPGRLVSAEPVIHPPEGMQAWHIRYWTTDGSSRPRQATAMVIAPREAVPGEPRRVLAWTHGTWGVSSKCAPSLSQKFWNVTPALDAVKRGYAVVAPDYAGLGSDGVHPFLVGADTARSVLDSVRALRAIPGAVAGSRYAVWGESQGGHAALWTAQRSRQYAPELELVGAAAAAPPTNLIENLRKTSNASLRSFFTAYIGYSWSQHYGAPMSTFGNRQTQGIITRLAQNNCIELNMKPKLGMVLGISILNSRLKNVDLGREQPWASIARRNSPTTIGFGVPLLIAQNAKDDLVAPSVTRAHARALCRTNAHIRWINISGDGHATSAKDSASATLDWIDERFAGHRAPSDCGRI